MKKILFISINEHVSWGGSEELWSKTAVKLKEKIDVSVLVKKWKPEPKHIQTLKDNGLKVLYKNEGRSIKKKSILTKIKNKIYKKPYVRNELDKIEGITNFDLIVISLGNHADIRLLTYSDYFAKNNLPYVLNVQLSTDLRNLGDDIIIRLKEAYEKAEKVFFLSKDNEYKTELLIGVTLLNKDYINNPFNYKQIYTPINETRKETYSMACVAGFTSFHKGQDVLISVLAQEKWKRRDLYLNLYGKGFNQKQLARLIKTYKLDDKIKIKGFVEDKNEIWEENNMCILPSRMEGQALAMLEAMSHGRAIICTKVGDAERLVIHDRTGFLIPALTFDLLDLTLENAWKKRNDWIEMGKMSRKHLYNVIKVDPVIEFSEKLRNNLF